MNHLSLPNRILSAASLLLAIANLSGDPIRAQDAQSNFGHARARRLADLGRLPSGQDIVVRDLINFHRHRLPLPAAGKAVALDARFGVSNAHRGEDVWLQVGYTTQSVGDRSLSRPCAVALVVDCSGSMAERDKMAQARRGLHAFVARLRPDDCVSLIGFSRRAKLHSPLRPVGDANWILNAINRLQPDGNTNLHDGLMLGINQLLADDHPFDEGQGGQAAISRRVIVLTDGIANAGIVDAAEIARSVAERSGDRIDVSTIGLGRDLDVPLLKRLADANRGLFHFVADAQDVAKVFVREADSLLVPSARRVSLQIDLPDDLYDVRVVGERAEPAGNRLHIDLPDLNAGATGVVMIHAKLRGNGHTELEARASIQFDWPNARSERSRGTVRTEATLSRAREPGAIDVQVRKNAAIAVLSQGLKDMASACDARRWTTAERRLRQAREQADLLYPGEDVDLDRVREIAKGHQKTLGRYVNRFRDV